MIAQATAWSDAIVAVAGIGLVTVIAVVVIWQIFGTWRARMAVAREAEYRKLAEDATQAHRDTAATLAEVSSQLGRLTAQTAELERLLKQVE
jgi:transposase